MKITSVLNLLEDHRLLPGERLAVLQNVAAEAAILKLPLYVVGGFVRDLLLEHPVGDFDLLVEGSAPALADALESRYGGKVTIHTKFRTAKWIPGKARKGKERIDPGGRFESIDLISARSETYRQPAALPTVKPGNLEDDLRRRDFTINALAVRLDGDSFGELYDLQNGAADLRDGLVRVLHARSFIDDPTRMYRAVRYEQRYGFRIVDETRSLIPEARALIDRLSAQRIRHELDLILEEANAAAMLKRLAELDLLKPIHASLPWDDSVRARLSVEREPGIIGAPLDNQLSGWLLWLLALSRTKIESLNKRLHFTAVLLRSLLSASDLFAALSELRGLKPSQCVMKLEEIPLPAVYAVYLAASDGEIRKVLKQFLSEWRYVKPKNSGRDLQAKGLPPGPRYEKILSQLRAGWLDGEVTTEADEQTLLEKLILDE